MKKTFLLMFLISTILFGCTDSNDPCAKSWQMLKNPRLDVIADELANLRAKISNGNGTQEDHEKVKRLQDEESQIWTRAISACK